MKDKLKHTPGPWEVKTLVAPGFYDVIVEAPADVVFNRNGKEYYREILSDENYKSKFDDAQLIAMAPELYELVIRVSRSSEVSDALKVSAKNILKGKKK